MKKIIYFLVFLLVCIESNAQTLNWSTTQSISSGSQSGYDRPRVVTTANNFPLIMWTKTSTPKSVRVSKWNGASFSIPYDIVSPVLEVTGFIGPEIASKGDTVYVIFLSARSPNNYIYLISSFDGGLTFSDTVRVSDNSNTHKFSMPNVTVNTNGNPIVSYMTCTNSWTDWEQMVKVSSDFGNTFSSAFNVSALAPGEPCDCCKSSLIANGNEVFLLFRNNDIDVRNAYVAKSSDGGLTFTTANDIDDANWIIGSCPSTSAQGMLSGDSIIIVRRSGANGQDKLLLSSVNSTDLQYAYNHNIDPISFGVQNFPEIAGNGDTIGVVWQDNRNSYMDCYFSYSTTGANTISGSVYMSDINFVGSQTDPDIYFTNGTFYFVYVNAGTHEILYRSATFANNTSITELDNNQLTIYPNPTKEKIKISTHLKGLVSIKNIEGKLMMQAEKKQGNEVIDISLLPSGIYTVELQKQTIKFIKQ